MRNAKTLHEDVLSKEAGKYRFTEDWYPIMINENWQGIAERMIWMDWLKAQDKERYDFRGEHADWMYWSTDLILIREKDIAWQFKLMFGA